MLTRDINGKYWHRGTQLGVLYMLVALLCMVLTIEPNDTFPAWLQHWWLRAFASLWPLFPLVAASHAYVVGQRNAST